MNWSFLHHLPNVSSITGPFHFHQPNVHIPLCRQPAPCAKGPRSTSSHRPLWLVAVPVPWLMDVPSTNSPLASLCHGWAIRSPLSSPPSWPDVPTFTRSHAFPSRLPRIPINFLHLLKFSVFFALPSLHPSQKSPISTHFLSFLSSKTRLALFLQTQWPTQRTRPFSACR